VILILDGPVPEGAYQAPVRLPEASDLAGREWWAYGFPSEEPHGNTASGQIGARLADDRLRLDTNSRYTIQDGFTGAGLWSPDYQAVVGIVTDVNARGDGQAITFDYCDRYFPAGVERLEGAQSAGEAGELALASFGLRLSDDVRREWAQPARGVGIDSELGDRFRGRTAALTTIVDWLQQPGSPPQVLVVTGSPGVGKSAVLARVVMRADPLGSASLEPGNDRIGRPPIACAVRAQGKTALEVAEEIARAAAARLPERIQDTVPFLRDALARHPRQRFGLIIDGLDEVATPAEARTIIRWVLLPLTQTCATAGARVVVGTRGYDGEGDILAAFRGTAKIVNLEDPDLFSADDLIAYAKVNLQLPGNGPTGSPYADDAVASPVAKRIAELSGSNFLIARLEARRRGLFDSQAVDPRQLRFTASVHEELRSFLRQLPLVAGLTAESLLTALAFAEAPGFTILLWQTAIEAISGKTITAEQLQRFTRSAAANFLTSPAQDDNIFQLSHGAYKDALLVERNGFVPLRDDERTLSQAFVQLGRQQGWHDAPSYLLRSLAAHAARAGVVDELLTDDDYLLHADLRRLLPLVDEASTAQGRQRARMLQHTTQAITATPAVRAALFGVTETLEGIGASYTTSARVLPYRASWATAAPRGEWATLEGHTRWVLDLCAFNLDDRVLLACAAVDGTIVIWNPATGERVRSLEGAEPPAHAVCAFALDGRQLVASGHDGEVWIWDPVSGEEQRRIEVLQYGNYGRRFLVKVICPFTLDDRMLLAAGSGGGYVCILDPATGELVRTLELFYGLHDMCAFTLDDRVLLATISDGNQQWIWDLATGEQVRALDERTGLAICAFRLQGKVLLASQSYDYNIGVWDPATGRQIYVMPGHRAQVHSICPLTVGARTLLASGDDDGVICLWDPATHQQMRAFEDQTRWGVSALAPVEFHNHTVLACSLAQGMAGIVRLWDPSSPQETAAQRGSSKQVNAVCIFRLENQALVASGGADGIVEIRILATGEQVGALNAHGRAVNGVRAISRVGRPLLVTVGLEDVYGRKDIDGIKIWDPRSGRQISAMPGHPGPLGTKAVCVFTLDGREMLATVGQDGQQNMLDTGSLRVWDVSTGDQVGLMDEGERWSGAVCSFQERERTLLATAGGGLKGVVRIWDPSAGQLTQTLENPATAAWRLHAVCAFSLGGRTFLASAGAGHYVQIWDPATGEEKHALEGHTDEVRAICSFTIGDRVLLASGAADHTIRIWDPGKETCLLDIPVHHPAYSIDYANGSLVVGLRTGIICINLDPTSLTI
jgi:WD40 repeat protein